MTQENISEEQIDQILKEAREETIDGKEYVNKKLQKDKENKPSIKNEIPTGSVRLGELGTYECATPEEIDEVFDKIDGLVFKMKKCMFRVCYVSKGQKKFSCELINEKKD